MANEKSPWLITEGTLRGCETCGVQDRIHRIKGSTDVAWLRSVVAYSEEKITVRQAAERRLRVLTKERLATLGGQE